MVRSLVIAVCLILGSISPAAAQSRADQIVSELRKMDYIRIEIGKTWLGRTRIRAIGPKGNREIVLNPNTGEILRDYWRPAERESGSDNSLSRDDSSSGDDRHNGADADDSHDDDHESDDDSHDDGGDDHDDGGDDDDD